MSLEFLNWVQVFGALGSLLSGVGAFFAGYQVLRLKKQEMTEFEDGFSKEYRELIGQLPPQIFWDEEIPPDSESDPLRTKRMLFRYIDLCNEQIFLRQQGRVSQKTWKEWRSGMKSNLKKRVFLSTWEDIKSKSDLFYELRQLEKDEFQTDPYKTWRIFCCGKCG